MGPGTEKTILTTSDRFPVRRRRVKIVAGIGLAIAACGLATWMAIRRQPPPSPPPGVPLTLAEDRAGRVAGLRYDLFLRVPASRLDPIPGRLTVTFDLNNASRPLAFDFAQPPDHLQKIMINGRPAAIAPANGHVTIAARWLTKGPNRVEFEFIAGDQSLNRGDDFMYSLFVPARASLALPCFDQPNLKGRWRIALDVPSPWAVVSNGAETRRADLDGRLTVAFGETEPLPPYLVAFAAGRFSIETGVRSGRVFRMFHRETDASKVARNREAIFDLHARAVAWLQDYTGVPYPFGKFDFVLLPAFQFSGMEHAGAIYYNANTLLLDESATQNQFLNRANTISHETAHMWFGDLVTMKWFNDVWMKEVFANFMAAKIVNPSFPGVNHELRFLLQNFPAAYDVDRTAGTNPIRQSLDNLDDAGSLYGAIIYQKAPIVMRQLEALMGPDGLRQGLREYLRRYAFANATWTDLIGILDARTPADLAAWSRAWVDEPGRPVIHTDVQISGGRIERLAMRQEDPIGRNLVWPQKLQIALGGTEASSLPLVIEGPETSVPAAIGIAAPRWILPVGGYGLFDLDMITLEYLSRSLGDVSDPYVRGAALVELWEEMLAGSIAPGRLLDDLLLALPRETDELLVQEMLDDVRVAYWRFTAADDRPPIADKIERVLRAGLERAGSTSQKAAWFDAFRRLVTTPDGIAWLTSVWRHDVKIPGLPLAENDEADIAAELALRDIPEAAALLHEQLDRFHNEDRRARFAFILPALSNDAPTRDAFFESLKDLKNRQHEPWVLDGARYLHHPLRAARSKKYIDEALTLTREIQQTGDIFFPKRWADATLGGYQSVQTAAEVRAFIDRLPTSYPPRLRWILLSAADPLFRAAKLLSQ